MSDAVVCNFAISQTKPTNIALQLANLYRRLCHPQEHKKKTSRKRQWFIYLCYLQYTLTYRTQPRPYQQTTIIIEQTKFYFVLAFIREYCVSQNNPSLEAAMMLKAFIIATDLSSTVTQEVTIVFPLRSHLYN